MSLDVDLREFRLAMYRNPRAEAARDLEIPVEPDTMQLLEDLRRLGNA